MTSPELQNLGPNQKAWLDALRSGKYQQGKEYLHYVDDSDAEEWFCCLGVLCHIEKQNGNTVSEGKIVYGTKSVHYYASVTDPEGMSSCVLPQDLVKLYGFYGNTGAGRPKYKSLAEMNDDGTPFETVADLIEADPSRFFYKEY